MSTDARTANLPDMDQAAECGSRPPPFAIANRITDFAVHLMAGLPRVFACARLGRLIILPMLSADGAFKDRVHHPFSAHALLLSPAPAGEAGHEIFGLQDGQSLPLLFGPVHSGFALSATGGMGGMSDASSRAASSCESGMAHPFSFLTQCIFVA